MTKNRCSEILSCILLVFLCSSLPTCIYSLDTACAHVTDKNTTVAVTQIRYDHKFSFLCAVASSFVYQSALEDPLSALFTSTASSVKQEIESLLAAREDNPSTFYDVVIIRFRSISSYPLATGVTIPGDVSLVVDVILSTSDDGVGVGQLQASLQEAAASPDGSVQFFLLTTPGTVDVCLREVLYTSQGTLTWPITEAGQSAETPEKCPIGFERAGEISISTRICSRDSSGHAAWAQFLCADCGQVTQEGELLQLSEEIASTPTQSDANLDVINNAIILFQATDEKTSLSILAVTEILEALSRAESLSREVLEAAILLLNLALDVDAAIIQDAEYEFNTSTRIHIAIPQVLAKTQFPELDTSIITYNIILGIQKLAAGDVDFSWYGINVYMVGLADGSFGFEAEFYNMLTLTYDVDSIAAIFFQFADLPAAGDVRLTYAFYLTDKLFQAPADPDRLSDQVVANGWIMEVHLAGVEGPVRGTVTTMSSQSVQTPEDPTCGAWNSSWNDGHGSWSKNGCQLAQTLNSDLAVCQCEERGTFALVRDVIAEPMIYPSLHPLVFIGAALAFLGAFFCFLVFILIKKLRKKQLYRIQAALCFPAAVFYLTFAAGQSALPLTTGCLVVSTLLHYFMLVTACSMVAIAIKFYDTSRHKAVESKWFAFNVVLPAWAAPIVVVSITVAPDPNVYQDSIFSCFLASGNPYALFFALLLPMVLCLTVTAIIFFVTNRNTVKRLAKSDATADQGSQKTPWAWLTTRRIVQVTVLFILCYVTWLFMLSVVYSLLTSLQVVFGICAIIQGIAFPIVFCLLDNDVKLAILALFGKGEQSSRSFKPYFSATQWHPNPDIVPVEAPKQFLDDTRRTSTLTRQSFDPAAIPISETEQRRILEGMMGKEERTREHIPMSQLGNGGAKRLRPATEEPQDTLMSLSIDKNGQGDMKNGYVNSLVIEAQIEHMEENAL